MSAILFVLLTFPVRAADGGCAACHKTLESRGSAQHDYAEWERSPHAKAAVACEACHGGEASAADKPAAHKGLRPSSDPRSPVYFTRVPATCGACHQAEERAFNAGAHGRELKRTGRGPNCVTCHGSMANRVLEPRDLEMTCTLCHRNPTQAFPTLLALRRAKTVLNRLDDAVSRLRAKGRDVAPEDRELAQARAAYREALVDWHAFDMNAVLKSARKVSARAAAATRKLELREGKP